MRRDQVFSQLGSELEDGQAEVAFEGMRGVGAVHVSVHFEVLFQLQGFAERLPAHLTEGADFAGVLPHVVQQVLLLPKDVPANVTLVLDLTGVDGNVFPQTVQSGKLSVADGADEVAVPALGSVPSLGWYGVCKSVTKE